MCIHTYDVCVYVILRYLYKALFERSNHQKHIALHHHTSWTCSSRVHDQSFKCNSCESPFWLAFLVFFWHFRRQKPAKIDKNTRDIRNPNQTPTSLEKMMIPKWKSSSFLSKVILLLVCQGTGTCCHGGLGDGVGSDVENPQGLLGILKWSKGLIPSGTWQGLSIILFDHASPTYFSWGWITACEEVCCGMLKMKEPLKSNRHCTALFSLVDTNSLRAGPIVWKISLKCMAKWCPARFLLDLCYSQLGWSSWCTLLRSHDYHTDNCMCCTTGTKIKHFAGLEKLCCDILKAQNGYGRCLGVMKK